MVEPQDIPVDRGLRAFVGRLAMAIEVGGLESLDEAANLMVAPGLTASLSDNDTFSFKRNFAGFQWHFTLKADALAGVASGEVKSIPMLRQNIDPEPAGPAPGPGSNESASIADSLLAAVGFGEGASHPAGGLLTPPAPGAGGSKVDFLPSDNLEETAIDEAEVTREEVDDLLNHPEVLKLLDMMGIDPTAPTEDDADLEPEVEDRTVVDMRVPEVIENTSDESQEEALDDKSEEDAGIEGLQQATQFLSLMVDAEKLELEPGADLEGLALRLIPLLDDETVSDRERATRLVDWLLDQSEVEDIFISDDEMTRILRAW